MKYSFITVSGDTATFLTHQAVHSLLYTIVSVRCNTTPAASLVCSSAQLVTPHTPCCLIHPLLSHSVTPHTPCLHTYPTPPDAHLLMRPMPGGPPGCRPPDTPPSTRLSSSYRESKPPPSSSIMPPSPLRSSSI